MKRTVFIGKSKTKKLNWPPRAGAFYPEGGVMEKRYRNVVDGEPLKPEMTDLYAAREDLRKEMELHDASEGEIQVMAEDGTWKTISRFSREEEQ
jgi:hypothetical protein